MGNIATKIGSIPLHRSHLNLNHCSTNSIKCDRGGLYCCKSGSKCCILAHLLHLGYPEVINGTVNRIEIKVIVDGCIQNHNPWF